MPEKGRPVGGGTVRRAPRLRLVLAGVLATLCVAPGAAWGSHNSDVHSDNMRLMANLSYVEGTDEAFWGNRLILGNYSEPGGFRVVDISNPTAPALIGQVECPGPQNDVPV